MRLMFWKKKPITLHRGKSALLIASDSGVVRVPYDEGRVFSIRPGSSQNESAWEIVWEKGHDMIPLAYFSSRAEAVKQSHLVAKALVNKGLFGTLAPKVFWLVLIGLGLTVVIQSVSSQIAGAAPAMAQNGLYPGVPMPSDVLTQGLTGQASSGAGALGFGGGEAEAAAVYQQYLSASGCGAQKATN